MATYVTADIHGEYDKFIQILDRIKLKDTDTLYILGDVLDRGPHPVKCLLKLMEIPNAIPIVGNHELMALDCLDFLRKEITDDSIAELDAIMLDNISTWQINGSESTINEFRRLDKETQDEVIEYIRDFLLYEELTIGGKNYLLVHSGIGNFSPGKDIEEYSLHDLVWTRADYNIRYFDDDTYVVSGHTPTQVIEGNPKPGYIYRHNNHIAIDCGACFPGGRLACICLDTGKEYYSD